jgi:hypothetical protein
MEAYPRFDQYKLFVVVAATVVAAAVVAAAVVAAIAVGVVIFLRIRRCVVTTTTATAPI